MILFDDYTRKCEEAKEITKRLQGIIEQTKELELGDLRCLIPLLLEELSVREGEDYYKTASTAYSAAVLAHCKVEQIEMLDEMFGFATKEEGDNK